MELEKKARGELHGERGLKDGLENMSLSEISEVVRVERAVANEVGSCS